MDLENISTPPEISSFITMQYPLNTYSVSSKIIMRLRYEYVKF